MVFECPARHNLRIKHLGQDIADKQVLFNHPDDVAGFLFNCCRSTALRGARVDPGQKSKKKKT